VELMAIRKILLPLQLAAAAAGTFSAAVMIARLWRAHLAVLYTAVKAHYAADAASCLLCSERRT
jgi:hypothetical protein